jgi:hypothetical protein
MTANEYTFLRKLIFKTMRKIYSTSILTEVLALCYYLRQPLASTRGMGESKSLNSANGIIPNIWFSHNKK